MTLQDTSEDVTAMLVATDEALCHLSLEQIEELCCKVDNLDDDRLWPRAMKLLFFDASPTEKQSLHWAVETHYGALMQSASGEELWRLSALAYARVIPLRLGYDESMGHGQADTMLVLKAVESERLGSDLDALRLLDVGCGTGELLAELTSSGVPRVEGIDVSQAAIRRAEERLRGSTAKVACMSLRRLLASEPATRYDVITLCDVLEHLPPADVLEVLHGLRRLLVPDGLLVVITPSAITGPHDLDFLPRRSEAGGGLHLHEYRLRELRSVLHTAGYAEIRSPLFAPAGRFLRARPASHSG